MQWWWKKKPRDESAAGTTPASIEGNQAFEWDGKAQEALSQSVAQAPVPSVMKRRAHAELKKTIEQTVRAAGRTNVTVEDVMQGLLSKLPVQQREKVEAALAEGPAGLEKLKKTLRT